MRTKSSATDFSAVLFEFAPPQFGRHARSTAAVALEKTDIL